MKVFISISPGFFEWALAISRHLYANNANISVTGLVSGSRDVLNRVSACKDPVVNPIYWLDELERSWLSTPLNEGRIDAYEKRLGTEVLRGIITADRQIGVGLVSGACLTTTGLMSATKNYTMTRRYVLGLLDYVFHVMEVDRPDLVFFAGVASAVSYAFSQVSRYFNVDFRRLTHTRIGTRYVLEDSTEGLLNPVARLFQQANRNPSVTEHNLPAAKSYLDQFRSESTEPAYAKYNRMKFYKKISALSILSQTSKDIARIGYRKLRKTEVPLRYAMAWPRFKYNFQTKLRARKLIKRGPFQKLGDLPSTSFAYFPLHVEPEASTMVAAPLHTNQRAVIELLGKSLPLNMNLIVKEHITMLGRRPKGFYKDIAKVPGVILASPFEPSISLVKNASITCVITGTAAWEAILLKKPALIIGKPYFLSLDKGFVHCSDPTKFHSALLQALQVDPVDDERLLLYLSALFDLSFEFPSELRWGKVTQDMISKKTNILSEICDRLLAVFYK